MRCRCEHGRNYREIDTDAQRMRQFGSVVDSGALD